MNGHDGRPTKRRKLDDHDSFPQVPVTRADQLHELTEFRQSTDPSVKARITAFKDHLASISHFEDIAQQSKQLRILKEYCEWQKAPSEDQVHFYDLFSTWSFAVENNAEAIASAVPAALTQLLKTMSDTLEFQPFGLALIDSLLRRDQSKLFEKCLAAPRSKPHLASPCLRLLTEMVSFGVGARATEFWTRRDLVMYRFEALLEQHNTGKGLAERRKPSVRRMALRLLLAMLRYLDADAKTDILNQGRTLHACLYGLPLDGDDIIVEILRSIQSSFLNDDEVSRDSIISFFRASRLDMLASLYRFEVEDDASEAGEIVRGALQSLLENLCTTSKGVVLPSAGWSSRVSTYALTPNSEDDYIDLGLDTLYYEESRGATVSNVELSAFIRKLRYSDPLQSSLLLQVLRAAPELVAEYFSSPQTQKLAPPDSENIAWRAHFAFLFSVIEGDVSNMHGSSKEPPQPQVVVESIVPGPIDRGYINKLLSAKDEILKISGARLLTVILKKLSGVLDAFARSSSEQNHSYIWQQTSDKLSELVEARIPTTRDVSLALQYVGPEDVSYGNILGCLHQYYKALPDVAATNTFDIGQILASVCSLLESSGTTDKAATLLNQLWHCVEIANMASSTKWLHKPNNETLSPLSRVLKVAVAQTSQSEARDVLRSLRQVLTYRGILVSGPSAFAALCNSLAAQKKFSPSEELYLLVDTCIVRTNQKPVKYLDEIEHTSELVSDKKPLSLVVGALVEQWSFACKKEIKREYLQDALDKSRKKPVAVAEEWLLDQPVISRIVDQDKNTDHAPGSAGETKGKLLAEATSIPASLKGLDKWAVNFDIELEVETNRLHKLLLSVSSLDQEIRVQTYQILQQIAHNVDTTSSHPLKHQVYLVLGEVCETLMQQGTSRPQPTIIPELANELLHIMLNPTHSLYARANKFVLQKPSWPAKRVVLHWTEQIFYRESDDADVWTAEVEWLLRLLIKGLRTETDLDLYRRTGLWEKVLSLYSSPVLAHRCQQLILASLKTACSITGGIDILWTRFGVYSWLRMREVTDNDNDNAKQIRALREKMEKECSQELIETWKIACSLTRKHTEPQ